jgi:hypothetical protein
VSIPGKLYEYLAAGRPLLAIAEEGEITDLVRSTGSGVTARPGDEADIERGLVEIVNLAGHAVAAPPALFDGALRAAETARVLERVIAGRAGRHTAMGVVGDTPR